MPKAHTVLSSGYEHFDRLVADVLALWPQHERYLRVNVGEREPALLAFSDQLSEIIYALRPDERGIAALVEDYRFLCEKIVLPEELHFRRHGTYRLASFEEADRTVYSDKPFMTRYMNGLLMSDVMWINHCRCMAHYRDQFLPSLEAGAQLLEVGPGHGLLLLLATRSGRLGAITAWDLSDASLALAQETLATLGAGGKVRFEKRNIFDRDILDGRHADRFHGVVLSEVLEHLEDPLGALRVLHHLCRPGGRVWINVPANSPAPDHLYLVGDLSEPAALLAEAGFEVVETAAYPTSGTTLAKAQAKKLTFNCVLVGRKPGRGAS